jgi:hypothetical protein
MLFSRNGRKVCGYLLLAGLAYATAMSADGGFGPTESHPPFANVAL